MEVKAKLSLREYWKLLVDYLGEQRLQVFSLAFLLLFSIGLQLANPQIVRIFLDSAETGGSLEKLIQSAALFTGVAIVRQVVQIAVTYFGENVAWIATNALRADLALHCLKLDMSFHKQYKPGELIERVDGDVNQLANFFSQMVIRLGGNLLLIGGVLVLLWWQDWRLGASITAVACLGILAVDALNKRSVPRWQAVREADARLFGYLEEWLNGTEEIRTSGAEPYIMLRLYQALRDRWQKVLAAMKVQALVSDLPLNVFALAYAAAHLLGNTLFREGQMSIGEIYLIFYYIELMGSPLWEILRQVEDLQRAAASIQRVTELRQIQPTILDGEGVLFPKGSLGVTFKNVTFHFDDDRETDVLKEISFQLKPGKVLGLLGRTGSGKSTLTKLLVRFYDPSSGSIELVANGFSGDSDRSRFDLRRTKLADLRQLIGMVTQDVQLFQGTVRQNLTLFDDTVPEKQIVEALKDVGLGSWLLELPHGLETSLEAAGIGLSAGEAQLLAFARVFLAEPGLVILDEASSRLDPATERQIEQAVERLLTNRTGIIIAHHLGTVQKADEIMILSGGKIAEYGSRVELASDPDSLFSSLLRTGIAEALV